MELRATAKDCLFLNWAVPADRLAPPPAPLRYEVGPQGKVFVTAFVFRHEGLPRRLASILPLSYPQLQIRQCVLDGNDLPAVLVRSILVPGWVLLGARWWVRRAAARGRFSLPDCSREPEWNWAIRGAKGTLTCRAQPGGAPTEEWRRSFEAIRRRHNGYLANGRGLRRIETTFASADACPVSAHCDEMGLVARSVPLAADGWPDLHSAWVCPEVSLVFALGHEREVRLTRQVPAPG